MRSKLTLLLLSALLAACAGIGHQEVNVEESVCGVIKEPVVFWLWNRCAGKPNPVLAQGVKGAEAISYKTADGRTLRGYRLIGKAVDGQAPASVLVAQGNAMLSDQLLDVMSRVSDAGIEVLIFDYRGYGQSEGLRRLKAITSDYTEIFEKLVPKDGRRRLLYGISFGGIVVANVIGAGVEFDRAVIDSAPSRLSNYGCEPRYDAVLNLPDDASRIMVIAGARDRVVKPGDSRELITTVAQRGGKAVYRQEFSHPFMDASDSHQIRMDLITKHLLGRDHE